LIHSFIRSFIHVIIHSLIHHLLVQFGSVGRVIERGESGRGGHARTGWFSGVRLAKLS
jgi:hypothetical protein